MDTHCDPIELEWHGPFSLRTPESRLASTPPSLPGVYLWTVGKDRKISYVGQAGNVHQRMYEHIHGTLGGAYWLYRPEFFEGGIKPTKEVAVYWPEPKNLNRRFLEEFDTLSQAAFKNLTSYEFYWAVVEGGEGSGEFVESALISLARDSDHPVQNERVSRYGDPLHPIAISSTFSGERPSWFPDAEIRWPAV